MSFSQDLGNFLGAVMACAMWFYILRWVMRLLCTPALGIAVVMTKFLNWLGRMALAYAQWSAHHISKTWVLPK
jgi:hypothetical protein